MIAAALALALAAPTPVGVAQREFRFSLYRTSVPRGVVKLNVRNYGEDGHNLVVLSRAGDRVLAELAEVPSGETASLRVRLRRAGRYPLVCTVDDHLARGMRTSLRVKRPRRSAAGKR